MKAYLAGKMSGIPQYNFPLFDYVAAKLRTAGWEIVTPSELDDPETRAKSMASPDGLTPTGHTWGEYLSRDMKVIADSGLEAICLLPGWPSSRGAKLEAFVSMLLGLQFYSVLIYPEGTIGTDKIATSIVFEGLRS